MSDDNIISFTAKSYKASAANLKNDIRPSAEDVVAHCLELLAAEIGFTSADAQLFASSTDPIITAANSKHQDSMPTKTPASYSAEERKQLTEFFDSATRIILYRLAAINPHLATSRSVITRYISTMTSNANQLIQSGVITHVPFSDESMKILMGNLLSKTSSHLIGTNIFVEHEILG